MSIHPLITFKAGKCDADFNQESPRIRPLAQKGYLYLYAEEDLIHFCWRDRDASLQDPELDLVMVPTDGSFVPIFEDSTLKRPRSPTDGRIFVLKFSSSSLRQFFWLQSGPEGRPDIYSRRDRKIGEIVNGLLQGLDLESAQAEADNHVSGPSPSPGDDTSDEEDDVMEDAPSGHRGSASGGAGADATGGDVRDEGEESREGGADGARASHPGNISSADASRTIQNFLDSIRAGPSGSSPQASADDQYPTIADLLSPGNTTAVLSSSSMTDELMNELLSKHLPSALVYLAHGMDPSEIPDNDDPEAVESLVEALESHQKKDILRRVFQSPQFHQACMTFTSALRDGGLPSVAEALKINVDQGGYLNRGSGIPMSGGKAVEAFVKGILKELERKEKE